MKVSKKLLVILVSTTTLALIGAEKTTRPVASSVESEAKVTVALQKQSQKLFSKEELEKICSPIGRIAFEGSSLVRAPYEAARKEGWIFDESTTFERGELVVAPIKTNDLSKLGSHQETEKDRIQHLVYSIYIVGTTNTNGELIHTVQVGQNLSKKVLHPRVGKRNQETSL